MFQEGKLEEIYDLEDALVVAMHVNAFIRHAHSVKMASIAQIVNVIAPIVTRPDGLVLQTTFYPFEPYRRTCGDTALDVHGSGDTFSTPEFPALRVLDVAATLDAPQRLVTVYLVNRGEHVPAEATVDLVHGRFRGPVKAYVVNGPHVKASNTFDQPDAVAVSEQQHAATTRRLGPTLEPHSLTAPVFGVVWSLDDAMPAQPRAGGSGRRVNRPARQPAGGPDDARMTRDGATTCRPEAHPPSSPKAPMTAPIASSVMAAIGIATVVSAGTRYGETGRSSNPVTDRWRGTTIPLRAASCSTPTAMRSVEHTTADGGCARRTKVRNAKDPPDGSFGTR